jgi:hypothetical protein
MLAGFLPICGPGRLPVQVSNFTVGAYCLGLSFIKLHSRHSCQNAYNTSKHIAAHHNIAQHNETHHNSSQHIVTLTNALQAGLLQFSGEARAGRNALLTNNRKQTENDTAEDRQSQLKMFIMYALFIYNIFWPKWTNVR